MSVDAYMVSKGTKQRLKFSSHEIETQEYRDILTLDYVKECVENTQCKLAFFGNENAKIYIDDTKGNGNFLNHTEDVQQKYFNPNSNNVEFDKATFFYIYKNQTSDAPQIKQNMLNYGPGIYRIMVIEPGEKRYFSYFYVKPKFLNEDELMAMRDDVESMVSGLSRSFEAINNGVLSSETKEFSADDLKKIEILHNNIHQFENSIYSIEGNPRLLIAKKYNWTSDKAENIDEYSNKVMTMRPDLEGMYSFKRFVNLDLRDNRVIKYKMIQLKSIINKLVHQLSKKISFINHKNNLMDLTSLKNDKKILLRYGMDINSFLSSASFNEIKSVNGKLSKSAMLNNSYRYIYCLVNSLVKKDSTRNIMVRQYVYDWIRTQDLYEIWGFVRTIKEMIEIGLVPVGGWIFSDDYNVQSVLEHGTSVEFEFQVSGNALLKLTVMYNKSLSREPNNELLWTNSSHNKPDILITIQDSEGTLLNVLVMDTKYRNLKFVYNDKRAQLLGYVDSIKSKMYFKSDSYAAFRHLGFSDKSPVLQVAILYPKILLGSEGVQEKASSFNISSIELRPNIGSDKLRIFIEKGIKNARSLLKSANTVDD
ncbi:hypothetical protein ACFP1L_00595 [Lactiplantibacillus nangangensis]|uniref:DUF2357 domain-containing protein n=2 Tax=Lactiplantibacillus nangangensis TaxID=2559917 RepID=A0ABW1SGQ2_9LACO